MGLKRKHKSSEEKVEKQNDTSVKQRKKSKKEEKNMKSVVLKEDIKVDVNDDDYDVDNVEDCEDEMSFKMENDEKKDESPSNNWPTEDLDHLINEVDKMIPTDDKLRYKLRLSRLDWATIAFKHYTAKDCKKMWDFVQKHVRCYRLLKEVVSDAKKWINQPWTHYRYVKRKQRHPDMPRRPLTSYMIYFMRQKNKENSNMELTALTKLIAEKYKNLTPEEKEKYVKLATKQREEYIEKMNDFYKLHPEFIPKKSSFDDNKQMPKKPFRMFFEKKLKDLGDNPNINRLAFIEKCKKKWKNLSDHKKLHWINLALSQTGTVNANGTIDNETYKKKLENILTKEERHLKEKLDGKPDKPPISAYILFSREMLQSSQVQTMAPRERVTHIAQLWKNFPQTKKDIYKDRCKKMLDDYNTKYLAYLDTLSEEDRLKELANNQSKVKRTKNKVAVETEDISNIDDSVIIPSSPKIKKEKLSQTSSVLNASSSVLSSDDEKQEKEEDKPFQIREQKPIYPNEPKLPPTSSFYLFAKKILRKHKRIGRNEIHTMWKNLSLEEKRKYRQKLNRIKKEFMVDFKEFLNSLSPEQIRDYSKLKRNAPPQSDDSNDISDSTSDDESDEEPDNSD